MSLTLSRSRPQDGVHAHNHLRGLARANHDLPLELVALRHAKLVHALDRRIVHIESRIPSSLIMRRPQPCDKVRRIVPGVVGEDDGDLA